MHGLQYSISGEEHSWLWKQKGRGGKQEDTSKAEEGRKGVGEARNGKWDKV